MPKPRYCNWAPDDLLQSHLVRGMKAEPLGAYCSLLLELWLSDDGALPGDPIQLAKRARLTPAQWRRHAPDLLELFYEVDGMIRSEIIDEVREKAGKKSQKSKMAVEARIEKYGQSRSKTASDDDRTMIGRSSKVKEKDKYKNPLLSPSGDGVGDDLLPSFLETWEQIGSPLPIQHKAVARALTDAVEAGANPADIVYGVDVYKRYVKWRSRSKSDTANYCPAAHRWIAEVGWSSTYPQQFWESDLGAGEPQPGRDFHWATVTDAAGVARMGRYTISDGLKTDRPFDQKAWVQARKSR